MNICGGTGIKNKNQPIEEFFTTIFLVHRWYESNRFSQIKKRSLC